MSSIPTQDFLKNKQENILSFALGKDRLLAILNQQIAQTQMAHYSLPTYGQRYLWERVRDMVSSLSILPELWWAELCEALQKSLCGQSDLWWEPSAFSPHKVRLNVRRILSDVKNLEHLASKEKQGETVDDTTGSLGRQTQARRGEVQKAYRTYQDKRH